MQVCDFFEQHQKEQEQKDMMVNPFDLAHDSQFVFPNVASATRPSTLRGGLCPHTPRLGEPNEGVRKKGAGIGGRLPRPTTHICCRPLGSLLSNRLVIQW